MSDDRNEDERLDMYAEWVGEANNGNPSAIVHELESMVSLLAYSAEGHEDDPAFQFLNFCIRDLASIVAIDFAMRKGGK